MTTGVIDDVLTNFLKISYLLLLVTASYNTSGEVWLALSDGRQRVFWHPAGCSRIGNMDYYNMLSLLLRRVQRTISSWRTLSLLQLMSPRAKNALFVSPCFVTTLGFVRSLILYSPQVIYPFSFCRGRPGNDSMSCHVQLRQVIIDFTLRKGGITKGENGGLNQKIYISDSHPHF